MTKEKSKLLAFSMVELLLVIALIGIISAFGVPAYLDYVIKSKVNMAFKDAKLAQTKLTGIYAKSGSLAEVQSLSYANSDDGDFDFLSPSSEYTTSITIESGTIVLNLDEDSLALDDAPSIYLELNSDGSWSCSASDTIVEYLKNCDIKEEEEKFGKE